jgi:hypothetical protein
MQNNRERILAFLETPDIDLEGDAWVGKYELERNSIKRYILDNFRLSYTNKDTGKEIRFIRDSAKKLTQHSMEDDVYKKSIIHIPTIVENMRFIVEMPADPTDPNPHFAHYRYHLLGFRMDGASWTLLSTVGVKNGGVYYDQTLFHESKLELVKKLKDTKMDDVGARMEKTDDITLGDGLTIHTPKFSRILKIWQGEF